MGKADDVRKAILFSYGGGIPLDADKVVSQEYCQREIRNTENGARFVDLVTVYASEWYRRASNHISDARAVTEIVADAMRVDPACLPDLPFSIGPDAWTLAECAIAFVDCWTAKGALPEPAWLRYKEGV